jgi:hypothetical protein
VRVREESEKGVALGMWTTKLDWNYVPKVKGSVKLTAPGPDPDRPEREEGLGIGIGDKNPPPKSTGRLVVRAFRFDGTPAAGLPVTIHHTFVPKKRGPFWEHRRHDAVLDESGEAVFDGIATGEWAVDLVAAGFLGDQPRVKVAADEVVELDFEEPIGGALDVTVVDGKGRPLPFAELQIGRPRYERWLLVSSEIDAEGRHRADLFTDHKGVRSLYHMPPGELEVEARYGARKAATKVTIESGETGKVALVLDDEP